MATAYDYIERNKRRSIVLAALFPLSFTLFAYLAVLFFYLLLGVLSYYHSTNVLSFGSVWHQAFLSAHDACAWILPFCFAVAAFWGWIALKQGDQIVLDTVPGVRVLTKWDAYDAYTLLENLCLASGEPMPTLYVLPDESMNAFAVGMSPERAGIVVSAGLLKRLDRVQLEAVLAHEMAHIRHYDTRLMAVLITCLAFFTFAGEFLFYGTEKENVPDNYWDRIGQHRPRFPLLMYVGAMLMFYGYFIAPSIRFALSRARESLADAEAARATRHPRALARALWRVSEDSRIELLDGLDLIGAMCLERPQGKETLFERLSGVGRSHPPVEERIRALNDMDGLFDGPARK